MTYARCVFVIHNMAHQGRAPFDEIHNLEFSNEAKEKFRSVLLLKGIKGLHCDIDHALALVAQFQHVLSSKPLMTSVCANLPNGQAG